MVERPAEAPRASAATACDGDAGVVDARWMEPTHRSTGDAAHASGAHAGLWVERLQLTTFRSYSTATLALEPGPVVLLGDNGAGKTNLLEAVSLLAPGQGLRRAALTDLATASVDRTEAPGQKSETAGWSVAARLHTPLGALDIGTGLAPTGNGGRIVRIDGETQSGSGTLAEHVEMLWLTPAMDGLFTGPASDRRRFLDRLTLCMDPGYRVRIQQFERAMQQRNRLLSDDVREPSRFAGLEDIMCETGVAIAAARGETVRHLVETISAKRCAMPDNPFPWAEIGLDGELDQLLASLPAIEVEARYRTALARGRERDRAAGRALSGPHRTDFVVRHGPKRMPARLCSTGEQKALLVGLVLAHATLLAAAGGRQTAPILLLDEITAHLDRSRRDTLFAELLARGGQTWMTGTDPHAFAALEGAAWFGEVSLGRVDRQSRLMA